jgi:multidrug resistance efflux pump
MNYGMQNYERRPLDMKLFAKFRFLLGILITVAIVVLLTLYLNSSMSVARSYRAELQADVLTVGIDYAGQVTEQSIGEGDTVKKGDELFTVRSLQFAEAYKNKEIEVAGLNFTVDEPSGDIIITAGTDGVVSDIGVQKGSFVSPGAVIASINTLNSAYVVGYYRLNPPDYARINKGDEVIVTLPDNTQKTARVFAINLERNGEDVDTLIKARILEPDDTDFKYAVGTPVEADLRINDKPWFQSILDVLRSLFQPVGK